MQNCKYFGQIYGEKKEAENMCTVDL